MNKKNKTKKEQKDLKDKATILYYNFHQLCFQNSQYYSELIKSA